MDLWKKTLDALQSRVKPYDFQHWILPIECDHIDDQNNEIVLKVPDDTHGRWVEENFVRDIRQTLRSFTESDYRVRFTYYGGYDDETI